MYYKDKVKKASKHEMELCTGGLIKILAHDLNYGITINYQIFNENDNLLQDGTVPFDVNMGFLEYLRNEAKNINCIENIMIVDSF